MDTVVALINEEGKKAAASPDLSANAKATERPPKDAGTPEEESAKPTAMDLVTKLNQLAADIHAIGAKVDALNGRLQKMTAEFQSKLDYVADGAAELAQSSLTLFKAQAEAIQQIDTMIQREANPWELAERIDEVRRARDEEERVSNAPNGLAKLIGLVGGFTAGWKMGGIKK